MKLRILYMLLVLGVGTCLAAPLKASALSVMDGAVADSLDQNRKAGGGVKERVSFKTNTVDWALMVANVGLEFDLSASPYGRYTLGANVRFAGGASASFIPKFDLKLLDVRCELRRYWRQRMTMREGQKKAPKLWRAYYWGVYAGYSDYTVYFSTGYKGSGYNLGGSFGYEMPLLQFKHGFLDLDLGVSAGFSFQQYDKSKLVEEVPDADGGTPVNQRVIVKSVDGKFIPYPMLTEIRVGLVYRFKSVRDKYTKKKHD